MTNLQKKRLTTAFTLLRTAAARGQRLVESDAPKAEIAAHAGSIVELAEQIRESVLLAAGAGAVLERAAESSGRRPA